MNVVRLKGALASATVSTIALGLAVSVFPGTQQTREAKKVRAPAPVVTTNQGESHQIWRYFGGPKGNLWPAASN